jgi:hypothetical protein
MAGLNKCVSTGVHRMGGKENRNHDDLHRDVAIVATRDPCPVEPDPLLSSRIRWPVEASSVT